MKRLAKKKLIQMMRMAMEALEKVMKTQTQTTAKLMNKKPAPAVHHPPVNMASVKTQKLDSPVSAMKDIQVGSQTSSCVSFSLFLFSHQIIIFKLINSNN